jgi:hypothetical protein
MKFGVLNISKMSKKRVNIFFAPVSSGSLYLNFEKSVLNGFEKKALNTDLNKYFKTCDEKVKVWGIRDAKKTTYNKTNVGDFVLFYNKGNIIGYSEVHSLFVNEGLSNIIWGIFENKDNGKKYSWSNIITFKDYKPCNVPFARFKEIANYSEGFSVRGYLEFRKEAVEKVNNVFGSLEKFIKINSVGL